VGPWYALKEILVDYLDLLEAKLASMVGQARLSWL
jgi:hypothetical protein